jgi:peptide/nickel transport system substrate-binding protein
MFRKYAFPVVVILSMLLSACGAKKTTVAPAPTNPPVAQNTTAPQATTASQATTAPQATVAPASQYSEAPMLMDEEKAGKIPPLAQRLPDDVFVVGPGIYMTTDNLPNWTPGKYGGTLRLAHAVANWNPDAFVMINEPFLMAPKIGDQNIVCNVCKAFTVSPDNTVFTFTLRKGLKWSDGQPVTTEDVRFAYEDIRNNAKLYPNGPDNTFKTGFSPTGNPGKLAIIDDYTFSFTFDGPYGAFLRALTIEGWVGYTQIIEPAHYLKQFHINYTTLDALKPELDKLNLTNGEWWTVFAQKRCQNWDMSNPKCVGYPALNPWLPTDSGNPSLLTWERNPYYFKVDTTGQQLPYIDKLASTQVNDMQAITLKITTGEVDFQRESTSLVNMPLYKQNEDKAGFKVALLDMHVDSSCLYLNETFDDADWKSIAQDLRFRQALSLAINRQELIDTIYYSYASLPLQTVGDQYSKYDVAGANKILDGMGLDKKNADGYRLYPDGKEIDILLENGAQAPDISPVSDLVAQYLKAIGLNVTSKQIDSTLMGTKQAANQLQMWVMWTNDKGWGNNIGSYGDAGQLWADWYTNGGKAGVEPPQWIKDVVKIDADKWAAVAGSDAYNAQVQAELAWDRANLPRIEFVEQVKYPMIVNAKLMNVPVGGYAIAANFSVVQMYFSTP